MAWNSGSNDSRRFEENSALITHNDDLDIGSSTYLVNKEWLLTNFKVKWLRLIINIT